MLTYDPSNFDIDIDLGPMLGAPRPLLLSSDHYERARPRYARPRAEQRELERALHAQLLARQWQARVWRNDRRRAARARLASRVQVSCGKPLLATDLSTTGLCCTGRPSYGLLDVEFKLPGLAFPVMARAEVASFRDNAVLPFVGLCFVDVEKTYLDYISRYIAASRLVA